MGIRFKGPEPDCLRWAKIVGEYRVVGYSNAWVLVTEAGEIYAQSDTYGSDMLGPFPDLESAAACAIASFSIPYSEWT